MASRRVSNTAVQAFGLSTSCALAGVVAGDVITVRLRERDGNTPSSVSSDLDGALALIANNDNAGDYWSKVYSLVAVTGGTHTISVTFSGNSVFGFIADAWIGLSSASPSVGPVTADNASGTSHSNGSITTTGAGLILSLTGLQGDATPYTAASGFTLDSIPYRSFGQHKLSTSAETTTATATTTSSVASAGINLFFADASGGASIVPLVYHHRMRH